MSVRNMAVGLLVASAALWISSGEAASCKKTGTTFCHHVRTTSARHVVSKSPPQPLDHNSRERDSISPQFRGG
ncbi:hypothetical protein PQR71_12380 [Paraburkholderia fungorum]|uniref:hypothetical protein n=1 Tax=Paraburkholderia fungorum TaxID=134537 RepID=UPI0038BDF42A